MIKSIGGEAEATDRAAQRSPPSALAQVPSIAMHGEEEQRSSRVVTQLLPAMAMQLLAVVVLEEVFACTRRA